jgi:uncharacterized membrane protein YgaE (UPF0421/DUF939 family)
MAQPRRDQPDRRGIWSSPEESLVEFRRRSQRTLHDRLGRTRAVMILAIQGGIAAGVSWFIANDLLHHPQPVFAPITAVVILDVSVGQRFRRAVEFVLGVALGIAIGDGLIYAIGTGAWQAGLVVALATVISVFVGGTPSFVTQASTTAVLVATLSPPTGGILYSRFLDALAGGAVALAVMALLLPVNPLTYVTRKAGPACSVLADGLADAAEALSHRDAARADATLTRLNEGEKLLDEFRQTVPEGRETATLAPLRWRVRGALTQYVEAADYLDRVMSNSRVLVRRAVTLISDQEPVPEQLPKAVATLAEATRALPEALARGVTPHRTAELAVQAVREAAEAYNLGLGFSGSTLVAQIRAIATDLISTAGVPFEKSNEMVRRAGGKPPKTR